MYRPYAVMFACSAVLANAQDVTMPSSSRLVQAVEGILNKKGSPNFLPDEGQWIIEFSWSEGEKYGKPRYIISLQGKENSLLVESYWPNDNDLAREVMHATFKGQSARLKARRVVITDGTYISRLFRSLTSPCVIGMVSAPRSDTFESPSVVIVARYGATRWSYSGSILNLSRDIQGLLESPILIRALGGE